MKWQYSQYSLYFLLKIHSFFPQSTDFSSSMLTSLRKSYFFFLEMILSIAKKKPSDWGNFLILHSKLYIPATLRKTALLKGVQQLWIYYNILYIIIDLSQKSTDCRTSILKSLKYLSSSRRHTQSKCGYNCTGLLYLRVVVTSNPVAKVVIPFLYSYHCLYCTNLNKTITSVFIAFGGSFWDQFKNCRTNSNWCLPVNVRFCVIFVNHLLLFHLFRMLPRSSQNWSFLYS